MTLISGIQCNLCSVLHSNVQRILRFYLLKSITGFKYGRNWVKTVEGEGGKIDHGLLVCIYSASRKTQGFIFLSLQHPNNRSKYFYLLFAPLQISSTPPPFPKKKTLFLCRRNNGEAFAPASTPLLRL